MNAPITSNCPKCQGQMTAGFVLDKKRTSAVVSHWVQGLPKKAIWAGVDVEGKPTYAIGAYRCESCGFLELYARDEFAAK